MSFSVVTYALAKKYTDETADQFGGLKGAPCKVKSVVKVDGRSTITLQWTNDAGETRESEVYVDDGIRPWVSGDSYDVGDLTIYNNAIYICLTANSDVSFVKANWQEIGGSCDYYIIDRASSLPGDLTSNDRKIYYCLDDGRFHLWDGIRWSTIDSGVKIRELTQAEYDALSYAEQRNGTIYFITDAEGGSGGGELTEPITAAVSVGGISAGTSYTAGTPIEDIISDLLSPTLYPSFTAPSASLAGTGNKLLETGTTLSVTLTATFNRGTINPAYGTSGYRAGVATGYTLNSGTEQQENTWSEAVSASNRQFSASVAYAAGEQPKDSKGNNYSTPLAAGSVNTNVVSYDFVDAMWANTANIATVAKLSLVAKSTKQRDMVFPAQTVANPEVFDIPASWTVTAVQVKNDLSGQYEDAAAQFTVTDTTHNDAAGNSVAYKRYTFNMGFDTGARTVRVKWS